MLIAIPSDTSEGLDDTTARLDENHPFAGKDVVFNVTVAKVESATAAEIAHSHAH